MLDEILSKKILSILPESNNIQELRFREGYNLIGIIKNNYKEVLRNKDSFDFSKYKKEFSEENYLKIEGLIRKYISYL